MTEDFYVWVNSNNGGVMRQSFYGGANVYIYDNRSSNANITSILPVEDRLSCLLTPTQGAWSAPFPDLSLFSQIIIGGTPAVVTVNGIPCNVFQYIYEDPQTQGNSTYSLPDSQGYVGRYTWYQAADDGRPIRFMITNGHDVVLGGSHVDNYILDYHSVTPAAAFPNDFFAPPYNMPCASGITPYGPTALRSHGHGHGLDFHHLFPVGHTHRARLFQAHVDNLAPEHRTAAAGAHRAVVFHSNSRYVAMRNRYLAANKMTYRVGLNHFAHMTAAERRAATGYVPAHKSTAFLGLRSRAGAPMGSDVCTVYASPNATLPTKVDNTKFALPPKDQGRCGSCWTFGATGAVEGAVAKATGKPLVALSQQNFMDCSWHYGNNGCNGGNDYMAYSWALQNNQGKVASADSYGPYREQDGFCHYDIARNWTTGPSSGPVVAGGTMTGCFHINSQWNNTVFNMSTDAMVDTLNQALNGEGVPVSVAVMATLPDFYFYTGGIYNDPACKGDINSLDHQVLAVGYDTDASGKKFTIIRNSWSTHWGENGYIRIAQAGNICGVATAGTFVRASA